MLKEILTKLDNYQLTENDPKSIAVFDNFETILNLKSNETEPKRKILIFSEYADTVKFVEKKLKSYKSKSNFHKRTLTVYGNLNESKRDLIEHNFNASADRQDDDYDIIITTDKLSEGFNLNRAGVVINYDIPWNPVRVIQRVGRINRIGKKVFDELMIVNFFPTEKGADYVRSREIASNKMFMIHNTLGEDFG
jgi:superfamily II DNA/RNA helicase